MSLCEESKENGKIERIEKYIESDAIVDIIMNFIIDNDFKEKCQKSCLFNPVFDDTGIYVIIIKLLNLSCLKLCKNF